MWLCWIVWNWREYRIKRDDIKFETRCIENCGNNHTAGKIIMDRTCLATDESIKRIYGAKEIGKLLDNIKHGWRAWERHWEVDL